MTRWATTLWMFMLVLAALPASANPVRTAHTTVALVAQSQEPAPGSTVQLAVVITPQPGWHSYWRNGGDSGLETQLDWQLPAGLSAGAPAYPAPGRIPFGPLVNYGYKAEQALLVDLVVPDGVAPGTSLPLGLKLAWLICDDELCVPEQAALQLVLRVGDGRVDPAMATRFARWQAAMPTQAPWPVRAGLGTGELILEAELDSAATAVTQAYFYPLDPGLIIHAAPQKLAISSGVVQLTIPRAEAQAGEPHPARIAGVLELVDETGKAAALAVDAAVDPALMPASPVLARPALALPLALLFALAGGLLLNVMPCVFPILSLKALSLSQSGSDAGLARRNALAYSAGVMATFALIGASLLALRANGQAIGWGFQLQNPVVVTVLALLMVAVALNLFGVFSVGSRFVGMGDTLTRRSGPSGSFWTGALAVVVATPCTAPFMAAALGAALVMPPALALGVFLALGLGMALPFLAIGFVPAMRRLLPRPGPWMVRFKQWLGWPMLATALWLFWVASQQAGRSTVLLAMLAAAVMALTLWVIGRGINGPRRVAAISLCGLAIGSALWLVSGPGPVTDPPTQTALPGAEPYSDARLAAVLATGKPAFVYFTADWCITCKLNERGALASEDVAKAFAARQVKTLVADWTRRDDAIARTLERYGRSGIPLYLYFPAGSTVDGPVVLPQLLTASSLLEGLARQGSGD